MVDTMSCPHHPECDVESGEPTGKLSKRIGIRTISSPIPCPYCWQAYAKHLKRQLNKYGGHTAGCVNRKCVDPQGYYIGGKNCPCDCGYDKVKGGQQ